LGISMAMDFIGSVGFGYHKLSSKKDVDRLFNSSKSILIPPFFY